MPSVCVAGVHLLHALGLLRASQCWWLMVRRGCVAKGIPSARPQVPTAAFFLRCDGGFAVVVAEQRHTCACFCLHHYRANRWCIVVSAVLGSSCLCVCVL